MIKLQKKDLAFFLIDLQGSIYECKHAQYFFCWTDNNLPLNDLNHSKTPLDKFCIYRDISGVSERSVLVMLRTKSKKFPGQKVKNNPVIIFEYKDL